MKLAVYILLILSISSSCHKETGPDGELGCDCQGQPYNVLNDALAIHNISLISILDPDHLQQGWQLYTAVYCNPEFIKGKVNDIDTVYVSGSLRPPCNYGDWNYHSRLEVTAIRRK